MFMHNIVELFKSGWEAVWRLHAFFNIHGTQLILSCQITIVTDSTEWDSNCLHSLVCYIASGQLFGPAYRYLDVSTTYHASLDGLENKDVRIYLNAFFYHAEDNNHITTRLRSWHVKQICLKTIF